MCQAMQKMEFLEKSLLACDKPSIDLQSELWYLKKKSMQLFIVLMHRTNNYS